VLGCAGVLALALAAGDAGSAAPCSCGGASSDSPSALNSFEKKPMRPRGQRVAHWPCSRATRSPTEERTVLASARSAPRQRAPASKKIARRCANVGARLKPSLTNFEDAAGCARRSRIVADAVAAADASWRILKHGLAHEAARTFALGLTLGRIATTRAIDGALDLGLGGTGRSEEEWPLWRSAARPRIAFELVHETHASRQRISIRVPLVGRAPRVNVTLACDSSLHSSFCVFKNHPSSPAASCVELS